MDRRYKFSRVKQLALLVGCLVAYQAAWSQGTTTVYKIKNPDGSVSYSDQPQDDAEVMNVEPISTVPAFQASDIPSASKELAEDTKAIYTELDIVNPGHDTAFYSGNGQVTISTKLTPALRKGHQFQFRLDGQNLATQTSGSYTVPLVDRGTHTLVVSVVDRNLKTLISKSSTFTIHRPKISRPSIR